MKDKGFFVMLLFAVVMCIADFYSTFSVGLDKAKVLEANIIFEYVGFPGLIIINILMLTLLTTAYIRRRSGGDLRFLIIIVLFYLSLTRIVIVQQNLTWKDDVRTAEQLEGYVTDVSRIDSAKFLIKILYYPMFFALIPYIMWRWDHVIRRKE